MPARFPRRARGALVAALGAALVAPALVGALASSTATAATLPHDAIGSVRSVSGTPDGLTFTGWAGDLDAAKSNSTVLALIDGKTVASRAVTSIAMPSVSAAYRLGKTPGFSLRVPVAGKHTVCVVAKSVGGGMDKVLKCVRTPLGTSTNSTFHSPRGAITQGWAAQHAVIFGGWADDPDNLLGPSLVTLYVDGHAVATKATTTYPWPRPTGASYHSAFAFRVPASKGAHLGCLWASNVGFGQNTFLGCKAVDTRAHQPLTGAAPASDNAKVVTEAKKHIGQRYVWAAAGPNTFDCSGLVTYAYGKQGYSLPHQSGMQFALAHPVPASSAVPGDLVFYHDSTGSVYHVGIYLKPGMTVAAIDTQEGVNYQSIYSSTWATYGSFTHK